MKEVINETFKRKIITALKKYENIINFQTKKRE